MKDTILACFAKRPFLIKLMSTSQNYIDEDLLLQNLGASPKNIQYKLEQIEGQEFRIVGSIKMTLQLVQQGKAKHSVVYIAKVARNLAKAGMEAIGTNSFVEKCFKIIGQNKEIDTHEEKEKILKNQPDNDRDIYEDIHDANSEQHTMESSDDWKKHSINDDISDEEDYLSTPFYLAGSKWPSSSSTLSSLSSTQSVCDSESSSLRSRSSSLSSSNSTQPIDWFHGEFDSNSESSLIGEFDFSDVEEAYGINNIKVLKLSKEDEQFLLEHSAQAMKTKCSWSSIQKADPVLSEIRRCTLGGYSPTRKNKSLQKLFYDQTGDTKLSKEMVSDFRRLYSKHRFRINNNDILESTQNVQVLFIPQSILPLVVQITHQLLGFPSEKNL